MSAMMQKAKNSKFDAVVADYLLTNPLVQLNGISHSEDERDNIFQIYYRLKLGISDSSSLKHLLDRFKHDLEKSKDLYFKKISHYEKPFTLELVLPMEMVADCDFDPYIKNSLDHIGSVKNVTFISDSIKKINIYKKMSLNDIDDESVDVDSLLTLKSNSEKVTQKVQQYIFNIYATMAFIKENYYTYTRSPTSRTIMKKDAMTFNKYLAESNKIKIFRDSYRQISIILSTLHLLKENTIISQNSEVENVLKNAFNEKYFKNEVQIGRESLTFWDALLQNWETIATFSPRFYSLSDPQKALVNSLFGKFEKDSKTSYNAIRHINSVQQTHLKDINKRLQLFYNFGQFGLDTSIFPGFMFDFTAEGTPIPGKVAQLINFLSNWESIISRDEFDTVFQHDKEGDPFRIYQLFSGGRIPTQTEMEWFERLIISLISLFFEDDVAKYNAFLHAQYIKFFVDNSKIDLSWAEYEPFDEWVQNSLSASGYALDGFTFFVTFNGDTIRAKVRSKFERLLVEKTVELANLEKIVLPQDFDIMNNRNLAMVLKYYNSKGKIGKSILDLGLLFSSDQGRGVLVEGLGYADENQYGRIYGPDKDLACEEYLAKGYVTLYIAISDTDVEQYYQNEMKYIGVYAPLLTQAQYIFLIDYMVAHGTGFEQSLIEIATLCDVKDFKTATRIKAAFGLCTDQLSKLNPTQDIPSNVISDEFRQWWLNWHNSNLPKIADGIHNQIYEQLHFNRARTDYEIHSD